MKGLGGSVCLFLWYSISALDFKPVDRYTSCMKELRKKILTEKALPEGYGRSVVGGREVVTAPSQKAVANPLAPSNSDSIDYEDSVRQQMSEESARDTIGYVPDLSQSFEPDSRGVIGDYHQDDLKKQYEELKANSTQEEMDSMVTDMDMLNMGTYKSKFLQDGRKYSPGEEEEAVRMLGSSIRYGRGEGR